MIREYVKHLNLLKVQDHLGRDLFVDKKQKNIWEIELKKLQSDFSSESITIEYQVYAHEIGVRHSYVSAEHAFLHGPSYLIGFQDQLDQEHQLVIKPNPLWSKISTGLKEISEKRDEFIYLASDYDELLDCPIEIGCHETDGFEHAGKKHYLAYYGQFSKDMQVLKKDIKKIVEHVSEYVGEIPYDDYTFITHFIPGQYGGLEHANSTVLAFDPKTLEDRMSYINWLSLVAHEYFHLWNVKRIRPMELGPFDYINENYTKMLWLSEGMTSFVDDYLVYKSGLSTDVEYLQVITKYLNRFFSIPGRRFESLENSSYNAWIKLYRPNENSANSTISYYLKGALSFFILHTDLIAFKKSVRDLVQMLWKDYLERPEKGLVKNDVLNMIESLADQSVREKFDTMISTTDDILLEQAFKTIGVEMKWKEPKFGLGITPTFNGDRVFIQSVMIDGAAYKYGLNAGDEILAVNQLRFIKEDMEKFNQRFFADKSYSMLINRNGLIKELNFSLDREPAQLEKLEIVDQELFKKF
jgi:predicted metalloprotease with PDZ domain